MKTMKRMMTLLAVGGLVLALAGEANAWLISVDLDTGSRATVTEQVSTYHYVGDLEDSGQTSAGDQIGVWDNGTASVNWWNYVVFSGYTAAATALRDADKIVTGVSVSYAIGANSPIAGAWGTIPNDDLLPDAGLGWEPTIRTTTFSGLEAGSLYNVIVYINDTYPSETVTINGQAASDYTGALANPGYGDAFDGIAGADFWYFENVAADVNGELVIGGTGTGYNGFSGFQVSSAGGGGSTSTPGTLIYGK